MTMFSGAAAIFETVMPRVVGRLSWGRTRDAPDPKAPRLAAAATAIVRPRRKDAWPNRRRRACSTRVDVAADATVRAMRRGLRPLRAGWLVALVFRNIWLPPYPG